MSTSSTYLPDSDVFIAAKNTYYAFGICPGFWEGLLQAHSQGRVRSIDRIRNELLSGRKGEDLVEWVENDLPARLFHDSNAHDVSSAYTDIMLWVQRNSRFLDRAKAKFATEADGWLVALSMVHGTVVVTNEQSRPESRSRVLLPDVCARFEVSYIDTFSMLGKLTMRFDLRRTV